MIRVLMVDDSSVIRELLVHLLNSDPDLQVVGAVSNGEEALVAVADKRPDVITMDVHMPKMNGLDATRKIMETHPTPIVVVSGSANPQETSLAFTAIEAGALAAVGRPRGFDHPDHEATTARLISMVKLMAEVPVVRRWARKAPPQQAADAIPSGRIRVVAIGASTGGPPVLHKMLCSLPADLPGRPIETQGGHWLRLGHCQEIGRSSQGRVRSGKRSRQGKPFLFFVAGEDCDISLQTALLQSLFNG